MFVTMSSHPKISCSWVHYSVFCIDIKEFDISEFDKGNLLKHNIEN